MVTALLVAIAMLQGAAPDWWNDRGVIVTGAPASDRAPATQGQLKNFARAAMEEMESQPGSAVYDMVAAWRTNKTQAQDHAIATIGQLKAVAKPFYVQLGLTYPWTATTSDDVDQAPATIGQLKAVFAFAIPAPTPTPAPITDSDGDGISNDEEAILGTNPNSPDSDWDGISDKQEQIDGTDLLDPESVTPRRIAYFPFDALDLRSAEDQLPRQIPSGFVGAQKVAGVKGRGIRIDQNNQILAYDWVRSGGLPNVALHRGSARMWFKPDWSSTGPNPMTGAYARLFDLGFFADSAATAQLVLHFNAEQPVIQFYESDGNGHAWSFTPSLATHPMTVGQWYEVVATWSPTSRKIYLNGSLLAEVAGNWTYPPDIADFTQHGLKFASDGHQPLKGVLDEVEFFNYELTTAQIATEYIPGDSDGDGLPDSFERVITTANPTDAISSVGDVIPEDDFDGDGLTNFQEWALGTNPVVADPDSDSDGMPNAYEATNGLNAQVDDKLEDADGDRVPNIFEMKHGWQVN